MLPYTGLHHIQSYGDLRVILCDHHIIFNFAKIYCNFILFNNLSPYESLAPYNEWRLCCSPYQIREAAMLVL